jgi:hypothetical protein
LRCHSERVWNLLAEESLCLAGSKEGGILRRPPKADSSE